MTLNGCSSVAGCPAPAKALSPQAYDLCLLRNETDDIAAPEVQNCYSELMKRPDTCESRTEVKTERCRLLNLSVPLEKCLHATSTEGLFVKGCEYPFTSECIARVSSAAR